MERIVAAEELINVYQSLVEVCSKMYAANKLINQANEIISSSDEYYHGKAKEEMKGYFEHQIIHLGNLINYYDIASKFTLGYFEQMNLTDTELNQLISLYEADAVTNK